MKNTDTNVKLGSSSNGAKSGVCKDFKDIYKLLDLIQDVQNSLETLPTNGKNQTVGNGEDGNE